MVLFVIINYDLKKIFKHIFGFNIKMSSKLTGGRVHHRPSDSYETYPSIQAEQVVTVQQLGDR